MMISQVNATRLLNVGSMKNLKVIHVDSNSPNEDGSRDEVATIQDTSNDTYYELDYKYKGVRNGQLQYKFTDEVQAPLERKVVMNRSRI